MSFAALRLLGPGYRFRTDVLGDGELAGKVWDGDLYLVGYGDPTLAPPDLDALARDVAAWGVRRVTGRVFGDEGHFDSRRAAPGWKPWFLGIESPPISALSVEEERGEGVTAPPRRRPERSPQHWLAAASPSSEPLAQGLRRPRRSRSPSTSRSRCPRSSAE